MKKLKIYGIIRGVFLLSCIALFLGVLPAGTVTGNTWTGSGPFATGTGNRVLNALAVSPDGFTIYAGTGSGTVFQYLIPAYMLDVTVYGSGSGTVTSSPSGIDCGDTCSVTYVENTVVAISAVANTGSTFTGWSGNCSGTDSPLDVFMDDNKSCTATFTLNQHTLTVNKTGTGSGTVSGGGTFDAGTTQQITAVAAEGSTFTGWSGDCSGTASPLSVLMDSDKSCTANFTTAGTYNISFSLTGSGAISCTPATVSHGGSFDCTLFAGSDYHLQSLLDNSVDVTLQISGDHYIFSNVTADHNVVANFQQNPNVLRLSGFGPNYTETWYTDIQSAYDEASADTEPDDIMMRATDFTDELFLGRDISVILWGGLAADFENYEGYTVIHGSLTISKGTVTVNRMIIR